MPHPLPKKMILVVKTSRFIRTHLEIEMEYFLVCNILKGSSSPIHICSKIRRAVATRICARRKMHMQHH